MGSARRRSGGGEEEEQKEEKGMTEVEIKLRLTSRDSYERAAALFESEHRATHEQENFFFDGAEQELAAQRAVLRLRFFDTASFDADTRTASARCVMTLKGKSVIRDGVGVAPEVEHDISVEDGRRCIREPNHILNLTDISAAASTPGAPADDATSVYRQNPSSAIVRDVVDRFKVQTFVCLGGFTNRRQVYEWRVADEVAAGTNVPDEVLHIELDETRFAHATVHEVEVETGSPELVKPILEQKLRAAGVDFRNSVRSKFQIFREGKL